MERRKAYREIMTWNVKAFFGSCIPRQQKIPEGRGKFMSEHVSSACWVSNY